MDTTKHISMLISTYLCMLRRSMVGRFRMNLGKRFKTINNFMYLQLEPDM